MKKAKVVRHAVHRGTRHANHNQQVESLTYMLDGIRISLRDIDRSALDPTKTAAWAESVVAAADELRRFAAALKAPSPASGDEPARKIAFPAGVSRPWYLKVTPPGPILSDGTTTPASKDGVIDLQHFCVQATEGPNADAALEGAAALGIMKTVEDAIDNNDATAAAKAAYDLGLRIEHWNSKGYGERATNRGVGAMNQRSEAKQSHVSRARAAARILADRFDTLLESGSYQNDSDIRRAISRELAAGKVKDWPTGAPTDLNEDAIRTRIQRFRRRKE